MVDWKDLKKDKTMVAYWVVQLADKLALSLDEKKVPHWVVVMVYSWGYKKECRMAGSWVCWKDKNLEILKEYTSVEKMVLLKVVKLEYQSNEKLGYMRVETKADMMEMKLVEQKDYCLVDQKAVQSDVPQDLAMESKLELTQVDLKVSTKADLMVDMRVC
jgi:hypothetical protein